MLTRYDLLPVRIDQAIRQAAILGAFPPVGASLRMQAALKGNTGRYSLRTAPRVRRPPEARSFARRSPVSGSVIALSPIRLA